MSDQETNNQASTAEASATESNLAKDLQGFSDLVLNCRVLLGKVKIPANSFLKLTRGSIIELQKKKSDFLDIMVNDLKVAEGEITLKNDGITVEVMTVYKKPKIIPSQDF